MNSEKRKTMERIRPPPLLVLLILLFLCRAPDLCESLNSEGKALLSFKELIELDPYHALSGWKEEVGASDPCSWFGIECYNGRVVSLNLKDLLLKGSFSPEIGKLIHMRSLILYNNSFYGSVPKEITGLQRLEVLDLGHNNLNGTLPSDLGSISSLDTFILRSNKFVGGISPELHELNVLSELQLDEILLSSSRGSQTSCDSDIANSTMRRMLGDHKVKGKHHKIHKHNRSGTAAPSSSPSPAPAPILSHSPRPARYPISAPSRLSPISSPAPTPELPSFSSSPKNDPPSPHPSSSLNTSPSHTFYRMIYISVIGATSTILMGTVFYFLCLRPNKIVMVRPWATGLSGQLRKAFVTGVPSLSRSELATACEDFSNIIDSLSSCILYKGTLSSGVEIAVASSLTKAPNEWSNERETQFRNKISTLSKMNHKNFINLLGYCEEEEPFSRMMVFEYAPNGTLFEHLHIKEAEQLDWAMRLRIVMGIAYCLEHMHQLETPFILKNLNSSSIYLTEDYAAKLSDLHFWVEPKDSDTGSTNSTSEPFSEMQEAVYKFGILLLEILSGKLPFSEDHGLLVHWASSYLDGKRPLRDMIDRSLSGFKEEDIRDLTEVLKSCINPDPGSRSTIQEVTRRLKEITSISADSATPKQSPLWWAELEIMSSES